MAEQKFTYFPASELTLDPWCGAGTGDLVFVVKFKMVGLSSCW